MITYVTHPWVITNETTGAAIGIWHPAPRRAQSLVSDHRDAPEVDVGVIKCVDIIANGSPPSKERLPVPLIPVHPCPRNSCCSSCASTTIESRDMYADRTFIQTGLEETLSTFWNEYTNTLSTKSSIFIATHPRNPLRIAYINDEGALTGVIRTLHPGQANHDTMSTSSRRLKPRAGNFRIDFINNNVTFAVTGRLAAGSGLTMSAPDSANHSQVFTQAGNYIQSAYSGYYTAPNNGLSQPGQAVVYATSGYKWFFEAVPGDTLNRVYIRDANGSGYAWSVSGSN
ncbi:15030_t:CDS:2, partial [Acaulospora colombiana]